MDLRHMEQGVGRLPTLGPTEASAQDDKSETLGARRSCRGGPTGRLSRL